MINSYPDGHRAIEEIDRRRRRWRRRARGERAGILEFPPSTCSQPRRVPRVRRRVIDDRPHSYRVAPPLHTKPRSPNVAHNMVDHLFEVYRRSPTRRARLQSLRWCLWTVPDDVSNMWSRQPITVSTQYRFQQNIVLTRWVSQSKALDGQIPLQSSLSAVKFYKFFCSVLRAVHQSADMYPGLRSHRYQSHLFSVARDYCRFNQLSAQSTPQNFNVLRLQSALNGSTFQRLTPPFRPAARPHVRVFDCFMCWGFIAFCFMFKVCLMVCVT